MHVSHYSLMLPDLFKHKTTRVRIPKPQVVLMDFHGTMSERHWEDKVIFPYVKQTLSDFLKANWSDETVQRCVPALRDESFEQRFRNKFDDAPVISESVNGEDELDNNQLAAQTSEFLLWQMGSKKETSETHLIERLVWRDGLKRRQILTPVYDDVFNCVRDWSQKFDCAIHVVSSLDAETLRLLFESTDKGNLNQFLSGFVSPTKPGEKMSSELYRNFHKRLNLTTSQPLMSPTNPNPSLSVSSSPPSKSPTSEISRRPTIDRSRRVSGNEISSRPILFLTDSGQEAKAASQVNDGAIFECVLVNRPGNKRFRSFYLSQFPYIDRFYDIVFVH